MEKTCLIISGGEFHDFTPTKKYDYVIACDKGCEYAERLKIRPDLAVGDFDSYELPPAGSTQDLPAHPAQGEPDSYGAPLPEASQDSPAHPAQGEPDSCPEIPGFLNGISVIRLPREKNDSDTAYAAKLAVGKGFKDITIICALGGRADHAAANIQTASYIAKSGGVAVLLGAHETIHVFSGKSVSLPRRERCSLSIFSLSDECSGVCIRGAKYNLENALLTSTFPLGLSNEWENDEVTVSVRDGILMIVESEM